MVGRRSDADATQTKQLIVRTAADIASSRGLDGISIGGLADVLGMSKSGVVGPFGSKEELFRALAHEVAGEMMSLANSLPPIDPGPEGRAELRAWLARFVEVYEHYGPVIRAWTEAEIGASEFGRLGTDVLTEFSRVLTGHIRRSSSPDVNPQIAALRSSP